MNRNDPRIAYVIEVFRNQYRLPREIRITYGPGDGSGSGDGAGDEKGVHVTARAGSFFEGRETVRPDQLVWRKWRERAIPFLFAETDRGEPIRIDGHRAVIEYDLLAASFYFLSGWQEYAADPEVLEEGRFPCSASLQGQLEMAHVPWVNYYFDMLKSAVEQIYRIEPDPRRGGSDFHLAVTHDVDHLSTGWKEEGFSALKQGSVGGLMKLLLRRAAGHDPWFNLAEVLDAVNEQEGNSSFYFLAESGSVDGKYQADYEMDDPRIGRLTDYLVRHGAEVGIHGSIGAHLDSKKLKREIAAVGSGVTGGRFHYLSFDIGTTPGVLGESGLAYDSTLGFAEQPGFRNAYAHPFPLYDLAANRSTGVIEIPLLAMDTTLQHRRYLNLAPGEAFAAVRPSLLELEKFHGAAALLWHNSYFSDYKFRGWTGVLSEILHFCRNQNGSAVSASTIVSYYTAENHR